ncbi:protein split ends isoform X2 [Hermetia illucens]|uniref:protein split ends isoform X2 n=1 Tax=Hermetia illucens TaxID=343691 RepID=UPI0018CC57CE|nr:protein split ends isoform X2 [Hermetia illucens]
MVRETRHLWVSNQPEIVREDRIRDHFKRSSEDVSPQSFEQRGSSYYDRNSRLVSETEPYIRRSNNFHDLRGRTRERVYRNGPCPYTPIIDRSISSSHHRLPPWYEGSSSISSISGQGSSPATRNVYGNVASAVVQPDTSSLYDCQVLKNKNKKSRSGSESPCGGSSSVNATSSHSSSHIVDRGNGGSAASSRSHSRSPSSCSSTNSTSSNSHASSPVSGSDPPMSSTSSTTSRSRNLQSAVSAPNQSGNLVVHSEDNRPLAICVRNLPARSSDTSLKDGLFHEYKKHGKVTWVKVVGQNAERYALVCFKKPEDVEKALEVSQDKLFFGCKIEVEPYQGYDVEDNEFRPYEAELDEYHPKSTRTLFIGNLEKDITGSDIRNHFECFGEIIEIDIKKQGMNAYAFCQYSDIVSVVKAMRKMDGEHLGNNRIKLGFGKSMPTNCVWIDGIADSVSENYLMQQFKSYGPITEVVIDRDRKLALVSFEQVQYAQLAVKEMRGATLRGRKLQVDFASRECREKFCSKVEKQTAGSRFSSRYGCSSSSGASGASGNPDGPSTSQSRSRASSFSRHSNLNSTSASSVGGSSPAGGSSSAAGASGSGPSGALPSSSGMGAAGSSGVSSGASGSGAGGTTPRGSRSGRVLRHSDYDYGEQRLRSYDEYSQGSGASHDDDSYNYSSNCLRSDSPQSRLGASTLDTLEVSSTSGGRRRCDKSPGDIRNLQKERFQILEQLEECPSSGDELVSPKKRMKFDHSSHHHNHHHTISSLTQPVQPSSQLTSSSTSSSAPSGSMLPGPTPPGPHDCNSNNNTSSNNTSSSLPPTNPLIGDSNCDVYSNHSNVTNCSLHHRKCVEVRRLSECSLNLKYGSQLSSSSTAAAAAAATGSSSSSSSRRPSTEISVGATTGAGASSAMFSGGSGGSSIRHSGSASSIGPPESSSMGYAAPHSVPCKRRRTGASCLVGGAGSSAALSNSTSSDSNEHHSSRGRGHQLHSHHSHEASGGESADGSRPGTPLCDERPEVSLSEPRRIPRDKPHEPMMLPLPKFGIQFFQQHRLAASAIGGGVGSQATSSCGGPSSSLHTGQMYSSSSINSSSSTNISNMSSNSVLLNNSSFSSALLNSNNSHSSLSNTLSSPPPSLVGAARLSAPSAHHHHHHHHSSNNSSGSNSSSSSSLSHHHHHHHHQAQQPHLHHHQQPHHPNYHHPSGSNYTSGEQPPSSPLRPRSLSSNSSDSDGAMMSPSPSIEERLKTLDEMYEIWSGGGGRNTVSSHATAPEHPAFFTQSRHKFLELDVNEVKPSEFAKRVLAKKSIFDDDLQRLKNISDKYEPGDFSNIARSSLVSTSPGIPNLAATKTPVVGGNPAAKQNAAQSSVFHSPSVNSLQRLNSPMNSPQAMSPYNSPSPSPVVAATMAKTASSQQAAAVPAQPAKGLQYPFPSHPPVVMTPTTPPTTPVLSTPQTKPKIATATKSYSLQEKPVTQSLSQPSTPGGGAAAGTSNPNRVLCKSASVPGSTNVGTVKTSLSVLSPNLLPVTTTAKSDESNETTTTSSSSRRSSADLSSTKSTYPKSTAANQSKKADKIHKQNHRNDSDTKKSKSEKSRSESIDKRKTSFSSDDKDEASDVHEKDTTTNERLQAEDERSKKSDPSGKEVNERISSTSGGSTKRSDKEKSDRRAEKRREKEEKEREEREKKAAAELEQREAEERERKERERKEREEKEQREREERERREQEERERQEELARKEREERDRKEREERERKEREERERKEREERERKEREERERREREERERKEREDRERREREELARREREECLRREREERERREREEAAKREREEQERKEREDALRREREERERREREEAIRREREERERRERERDERERRDKEERERREREEREKQAEEQERKEREEQLQREREERERKERERSETKEREEHATDKRDRKDRDDSDRRDRKDREERRMSEQQTESNVEERSDHDADIKLEDLGERISEHRVKQEDFSQHLRQFHHHKDDKHHHKDNNNDTNSTINDDNSLPAPQTKRRVSATSPVRMTKRRLSSQDSIDAEENPKRLKTNAESRKTLDRLDSKDSNRSSSKHHKSHNRASSLTKNSEDKLLSPDERCRKDSGFEEKKAKDKDHKKYDKASSHKHKKSSSASMDKEDIEIRSPTEKGHMFDMHDIRSSDDDHQHQQQRNRNRKEHKEKKRHEHDEEPHRRSSDSKRHDHNRHDRKLSARSEESIQKNLPEKSRNKPPSRKMTQSSNESDSDEPKKHSIFDILDDGPYVSMYDKVKARSCKNMQKQEEEKKIKAKFSQLKQSRAKREEKKRSTSYDGDSDSDFDDRPTKYKRSGFINSSSDEESSMMNRIKDSLISDSDSDVRRVQYNPARLKEICDGESSEGGSIPGKSIPCKKISSKRNSRSTRIVSDSSDTESLNRIKSESREGLEESRDKHDNMSIKQEVKVEDEPERKTKSNRFGVIKTEKEELPEESSYGLKIEIKEEPNDDIYSSHVSESEANVCSGSAVESKDSVLEQLFASDVRKKHKKSKKRQKLASSHASEIESDKGMDIKLEKHSPTSMEHVFDELKRETVVTSNSSSIASSMPHFPEKKKHKDRKEKKREKSREEYEKLSKEERHRLKKSKKSKVSAERYGQDAGTTGVSKRSGEKMEDIFGPISDDETQLSMSDSIPKDSSSSLLYDNISTGHNMQPVVSAALNPYKQEPLTPKSHTVEENEENKQKTSSHAERERHRKEKREKKRKERERNREQHALAAFQQQKHEDENSVDLDEAGRALEAQLMEDSDNKLTEETTPSTATTHKSDMHDVFRFSDGDENSMELVSQEKKEHTEPHKSKEKKKKKKRSKEERHQKREHHHHASSTHNNELPTLSQIPNKLSIEISSPTDVGEKSEELCKPSPSLPCLLDESPPRKNNSSSDLNLSISPLSREQPNMISPIPKTPTISSNAAKPIECKKKPDKFIPGFDVELDEKISESAVKSISTEFTSPNLDPPIVEEPKIVIDSPLDTKVDKIEEKSRVVISQEETEDAVAALLGESFGTNTGDYSFGDDGCEIQPEEEVGVQDSTEPIIPEEEAEEMRKAVQSLSTEDIEIKPDTPQSEQDLQIDTDTEEPEDDSQKTEDQQPENSPPATEASTRKPPVAAVSSASETKPAVQTNATSVITANTNEPKVNKEVETPKKAEARSTPQPEPEKPVEVAEKVERSSPQIPFATTPRRSSQSPVQQQPTPASPSISVSPKPTLTTSRAQTQFVMQPPTISIPESATFVYPPINVTLSPRPSAGGDHRMPSPRHIQQQQVPQSMGQQSPAAQFVNVRVSSPQSPSMRANAAAGIRHPTQLSPVMPAHMVIQQRQLMSPPSTPTASQSQTASQGNITLNRIPVTTVLAPTSKPIQQTNIILPQPNTAHASIITTGDSKDQKPIVPQTAVYQSVRVTTPTSSSSGSPISIAGQAQSPTIQLATQPTIKSVIETYSPAQIQQIVPIQVTQSKGPSHQTVVLQSPPQSVSKHQHLQTVQSPRSSAPHPPSQSQQMQQQMVNKIAQQQMFQQQMMQQRQQIQIQQHQKQFHHQQQHTAQIIQMQQKQQQKSQQPGQQAPPQVLPGHRIVQQQVLQVHPCAPQASQTQQLSKDITHKITVPMPAQLVQTMANKDLQQARIQQNLVVVRQQQPQVTPKQPNVPQMPSQPQISQPSQPIILQQRQPPLNQVSSPLIFQQKIPAQLHQTTIPNIIHQATVKVQIPASQAQEPNSQASQAQTTTIPLVISSSKPSVNEDQNHQKTVTRVESPTKAPPETKEKEHAESVELTALPKEREPEVHSAANTNDTKKDVAKSEPKSLSPQQQQQELENVSVIKSQTAATPVQPAQNTVLSEENVSKFSVPIDDQLEQDSKEDWSAKELNLNIESVIKKVDALCSNDEDTQINKSGDKTPTEIKEDVQKTPSKVATEIKESTTEKATETPAATSVPAQEKEPEHSEAGNITEPEKSEDTHDEEEFDESTESGKAVRGGKRGGRANRGGKKAAPAPVAVAATPQSPAPNVEGVQTRRGKTAQGARGRKGRGGQSRSPAVASTPAVAAGEKKTRQQGSDQDVYEFHEDSGEENVSTKAERPRLILTIKSPGQAAPQVIQTKAITGPAPPSQPPQPAPAVAPLSATPMAQPQPPSTQVAPEATTPPQKEQKEREEFPTPATNTRKSRRLLEKDGGVAAVRNTVDDTIEDVVRNSSSPKIPPGAQTPPRRSTRNSAQVSTPRTAPLQPAVDKMVDARKSPRANRRSKDRKISETSVDSSDEKGAHFDEKSIKSPAQVQTQQHHPQQHQPQQHQPQQHQPQQHQPQQHQPQQHQPQQHPPQQHPPQQHPPQQQSTASEIESASSSDKKSAMEVANKDKEAATNVPTSVCVTAPSPNNKPLERPTSKPRDPSETLALIDPVTGVLTVVQQSKEGQYVPVPGAPIAPANAKLVGKHVSQLLLSRDDAKLDENAKQKSVELKQPETATVTIETQKPPTVVVSTSQQQPPVTSSSVPPQGSLQSGGARSQTPIAHVVVQQQVQKVQVHVQSAQHQAPNVSSQDSPHVQVSQAQPNSQQPQDHGQGQQPQMQLQQKPSQMHPPTVVHTQSQSVQQQPPLQSQPPRTHPLKAHMLNSQHNTTLSKPIVSQSVVKVATGVVTQPTTTVVSNPNMSKPQQTTIVQSNIVTRHVTQTGMPTQPQQAINLGQISQQNPGQPVHNLYVNIPPSSAAVQVAVAHSPRIQQTVVAKSDQVPSSQQPVQLLHVVTKPISGSQQIIAQHQPVVIHSNKIQPPQTQYATVVQSGKIIQQATPIQATVGGKPQTIQVTMPHMPQQQGPSSQQVQQQQAQQLQHLQKQSSTVSVVTHQLGKQVQLPVQPQQQPHHQQQHSGNPPAHIVQTGQPPSVQHHVAQQQGGNVGNTGKPSNVTPNTIHLVPTQQSARLIGSQHIVTHAAHQSSHPHQQPPGGATILQAKPAHQQQIAAPNKGVIGLHQSAQAQIMTGAVPSPPLKQSLVGSQQPVVTGASSLRASVPPISPQGQARSHMLQPGLATPAFEATMHDMGGFGAQLSQSPPPAHQQASPITPGEATFAGGAIRGMPRDPYIMYQQYYRTQPEARIPYIPRSPLVQGSAADQKDMSEVDDAMVASPPLELRRPGSGPRTIAVPHSLQSPQDRATDSPQVAQVYVHTRIPHPQYQEVSSRYYEPVRQVTAEPPPAHRPPHSVVAPSPSNFAPQPSPGPPTNLTHLHPKMLGREIEREQREREQREREQREREQREREQRDNEARYYVDDKRDRLQRKRDTERTSIPQGHTGMPSHDSLVPAMPTPTGRSIQVATPPHASQVPPQGDSLLTLLQRYPLMWQGLLALKTDQAAVQMHFVFGNPLVARGSLPCNSDGSTPPLRIAQRMRLEQTQLEGVAKKMQYENEHCMLLALPCGRNHMDVLQQSRNLQTGFITYLQQKMAAGIVNIPVPGSDQAAYVVHIFPSCDFANENLERAAPDLKHRVAEIAHLLIIIATV